VGGADGLSVAALCDIVVAGHGHGAESNKPAVIGKIIRTLSVIFAIRESVLEKPMRTSQGYTAGQTSQADQFTYS
jgi:uncharacterized membrane protein YadS